MMDWYKRYRGTAFDPKFKAVALEARSTRCHALAVWDVALEFASEHDDRGSVLGLNPLVVASGLDLAVDEVKRILAGFVALGMIAADRIAKWAKRQGAAAIEKLKVVSAAAQRTRRYRKRKAEEAREPEIPGLAAGVTRGVTRGVTVTTEEEGVAQRIPLSNLRLNEGNPSGRNAPLKHPASGNVVKIEDSPTLKAQKKEARRQKVIRFILAKHTGAELERRMNGMLGVDDVRDEQWWFDKCDAERILAGWDDIRDKERPDSWQRVG